MKRSTSIVWLLILVFLLIPAGVTAVPSGTISVESTPVSAVYFDGAYIGQTPITRAHDVGSVVVKLHAENYDDYSETVTVQENSTVSVSHTFQRETGSISEISPAAGGVGNTVAFTITGTGFTTNSGGVRLMKSGESNITASIDFWNNTYITGEFYKIPSNTETGKWDLVVVNGYADIVKDDGFTIRDSVTLTSINPTSGQRGDEDVDFTLAGKNLDDTEKVYLYNEEKDLTVTAHALDVASTKITGTFDFEDAEQETYDVCVKDNYGAVECDLSFEITTDEVGRIDVSSSPSGASVYVDGVLRGTTPEILDDIVVGSHKIIVKMVGYQEYGRVVNVEADETIDINANLYPLSTNTPVQQTSAYQTTSSYVRTTPTKTSSLKVPTSWPSATPTEASPLDPVIVIGAVSLGLGLVMFRRR